MLAPVRTSVPATTNGSRSASCSLAPTASAAADRARCSRSASSDQELVAPLAGEHVGVAQHAAQAGRDGGQQLVAGSVSEPVVDLLEVVEVDEQQRDRGVGAPGAGERQVELLLDQDPVGQAGQRVVIREVRQLLLTAATLRDVSHEAVHHRLVPV